MRLHKNRERDERAPPDKPTPGTYTVDITVQVANPGGGSVTRTLTVTNVVNATASISFTPVTTSIVGMPTMSMDMSVDGNQAWGFW